MKKIANSEKGKKSKTNQRQKFPGRKPHLLLFRVKIFYYLILAGVQRRAERGGGGEEERRGTPSKCHSQQVDHTAAVSHTHTFLPPLIKTPLYFPEKKTHNRCVIIMMAAEGGRAVGWKTRLNVFLRVTPEKQEKNSAFHPCFCL